jgi:hypothetical protein
MTIASVCAGRAAHEGAQRRDDTHVVEEMLRSPLGAPVTAS